MYKILLAVVLLTSALGSRAQGFFSPVPRPAHSMKVVAGKGRLEATFDSTVTSTMNAWRPIVVAAAYSEPGSILMAGTGFGYQHLNWNVSSQAWSCQWSVNAVAFAGGSTIPSTPATVMSVGILGGLDNNLLMLGPVYNFGTKQIGIGVSVGINFNNGLGL